MATTNFFKGGNSSLLEPVEQTAENPSSTSNYDENTIIWNTTAESWYKLVSGSWTAVTFDGASSGSLSSADIDTLAELNAIVTDATLVDEDHTHTLSDVTDSGDLAAKDTVSTSDFSDFSGDVKSVVEPVTLNSKGSGYTFALTDAGTIVVSTGASAINFTVPPNSSVAFPTGTTLGVMQTGVGTVTIASGSGVTVNTASSGTAISAQYGVASLLKVGTDSWVAFGDLA